MLYMQQNKRSDSEGKKLGQVQSEDLFLDTSIFPKGWRKIVQFVGQFFSNLWEKLENCIPVARLYNLLGLEHREVQIIGRSPYLGINTLVF